MKLELKAVWTGDVHGPDRGLLCALESRHPIRDASTVILTSAMIGRNVPVRVTLSTFDKLCAALREPSTSAELKTRCRVSQCVLDNVFYQLRLDGKLRSRELARTFAGPRKVYWIPKDGHA